MAARCPPGQLAAQILADMFGPRYCPVYCLYVDGSMLLLCSSLVPDAA